MQADPTRRKLIHTGTAALVGALFAGKATAQLTEQPELEKFQPAEISDEVHFLLRSSYGPTVNTVRQVQRLGWEAYLNEQLREQQPASPELDRMLSELFPVLNKPTNEIAFDAEFRRQAARHLIAATLFRRSLNPNQLFEKAVEFWSDHFSISIRDGATRYLKLADDRDVIRPNAFGRFADLLLASAQSPAMLIYLDNYSNTASGPNENYARELLELHTLGVDGGYTEQDVIEVARCFTGWGISRRSGNFRFRQRQHDTGEKLVLGEVIPPGGGLEDGLAVLQLLAHHPSTAHNIAFKLCRRFVNDQPDPAIVDAVAEQFMLSNGEIRDCLRALFTHEQFWSNQLAKTKRPMDFAVSALRVLNPEPTPQLLRLLANRLGDLNHVPFTWPAPNGFPDVGAYWINAGSLINRWNMGTQIAALSSATALQRLFDGADTPNGMLAAAENNLLYQSLSEDERNHVLTILFADIRPNQRINQAQREYAIALFSAMVAHPRYHQV